MAQAAAKVEPVKFDERVPEIDPSGVTVNDQGQVFRHVLVRLGESMIADDLRSPKVWKRVQQSRQKALLKLDHLTILTFDESQVIKAIVTYADDSSAHLAIEKTFAFGEQGASLYADGTKEVFWDGASYRVRWIATGQPIDNIGHTTEVLAKAALQKSYPVKVP